MGGSSPQLSPMNGMPCATPCRDVSAWQNAKHSRLQHALIQAFMTLHNVLYAHREVRLPRVLAPGVNSQAMGGDHPHANWRSDIALTELRTGPEGPVAPAQDHAACILNAQGDSAQHLDVLTACAGSLTGSSINIPRNFPHNARAVNPNDFLTKPMKSKINHYKTWHGVEVQPIAFEMTGGRHIDTDKYLNKLFRKSVKIGDPYAMRRLYALRRQCSFICARIVGQQTATAPANFKNNPHRPFDRPVLHNRRA